MIRLIGILTGSAIGAVLLIVALGLPELRLAGTGSSAAPPAAPATDAVLQPDQDSVAATELAAIVPDDAAPTEAKPANEPEPEIVIEEITAPVERQAIEPPIAEQHWYAFWSPFRSQFAADGFVAQLQRSTGLDYRVVKLKPGVYEVAFAYSDDLDIEDKLTQISLATGLDLSGG